PRNATEPWLPRHGFILTIRPGAQSSVRRRNPVCASSKGPQAARPPTPSSSALAEGGRADGEVEVARGRDAEGQDEDAADDERRRHVPRPHGDGAGRAG